MVETTKRKRAISGGEMFVEKEKVNVMRVIDEYDFISVVLKYKAVFMPEDLVEELTELNNANGEIIRASLSLELAG